jgi:spoIIIJ-associated protein
MVDDELARRGQNWLEQLLHLLGLSSTVRTELNHPLTEGSCWLEIDDGQLTPDQIHTLIGQDGAVLDSIQYLANTILNLGQAPDHQGAVTVELAGYRLRRYEELKQIADQAVQQVRETGNEMELKSLSSAERRQVHTILKQYPDMATYSRGQEPDRRLVIRLAEGLSEI